MTRTATAPIEADLNVNEASQAQPIAPVIPVREAVLNLHELQGTTVNKTKGSTEMVPQWIAFLTNAIVKQNGEAVMGVGTARYLKDKFPHLPEALGKHLAGGRNFVTVFRKAAMMTFPHQAHWRNPPVESIVLASAQQLMQVLETVTEVTAERPIYVERPGYFVSDPSKSLDWPRLAAKLAKIVDDRVVFVTPERAGARFEEAEL